MNFLVFFITFFAFIQTSFQANCSDAELKSITFLPVDVSAGDVAALLNTHNKLVSAGKKYVANKKSLSPEILISILPNPISKDCSTCFFNSIVCTIEHCKVKCMSNECSKGCQQCVTKYCSSDLIKCIGQDIADPCKYKK